jgi:choline-sulfatase
VGAYGAQTVRTPNLNRLAARSVVFERHYTSCPLCAPARSSLHTGRFPHNCGAIINGFGPHGFREQGCLRPEEITAPELLAQAGYHVIHVGVDHVRADPPLHERGCFARYVSNPDHRRHVKARGLQFPDLSAHQHPCPTRVGGRLETVRFSSPDPGRHPFPVEDYLDVFFANQAVAALRQAPDDRPFALFCFLWLPHPPFVIPEPYCSLYSPDQIALPPNVPSHQEGKPAMHLHHLPGQVGAGRTADQWRATWASYYGCVTLVDECVGRVLDALQEKGAAEDTLVLFHPDHGEMLGAHHYFQKMVCYEESAHVPLMIAGPGIEPGRSDALTSHVDILPTLLDYAGVPVPAQVQGTSLRPLLEGTANAVHDAVFVEYNGNVAPDAFQRCVISGTHKYIHNEGDRDELYDLRNDSWEDHNLAADPAYQDVRGELRARLSQWMQETEDFLPPLTI